MGLAKRIIPCMDVDAGRVVKGVRFQGLRDAGDPVECAARYEEQGADEIVVLPYFMAAGRHVVTDVPEEVEPVRARHPDVKIRITPHLGSAELLPSLLLGLGSREEDSVQEALS